MDVTRRYGGSSFFFPAVAGLERSIHPLMAWWVVLYTVSMLARYQPAEWAAHINIDACRHAVYLEDTLAAAVATVPELIAEAIDEVANPRSYLASIDPFGPGTLGPDAW